ncbi:dual oxidase-like isoform X1 [Centruroides sculpturatus]|uniref:dual oxidase-like isoform X1 n=2 Tax=Centruroides sculpturatus TaxID=218467 RepID=UPI000C6D1322|nr:dual oxidase-like isoform X1 [Centruroides sculpturatus]
MTMLFYLLPYTVRLVFIIYVIPLVFGAKENNPKIYSYKEKQRYDGWYNNLAHPDWGSVESQLTRRAPSSYSDGVYMMSGIDRPNARKISLQILNGEDGQGSIRNLTALFAFFGQVVTSEILMASEPGCPIEVHRVKIDRCDTTYDRNCKGAKYMPFHRALYDSKTGQSPNNPREQLNLMTSWIDGSFVYSSSEAWLNSMRSFKNGTLRTDHTGRYPPKNRERVPLFNSPPSRYLGMLTPERMYLLGDARTNQNPAILAFGILFHRWHNVLAERIQIQNPDWSDEEVFQQARRWVIATLQNIILYEYLPLFLGEAVEPYKGYKPDLHPGISHVFQSAAFRFGHTTVPPGIYRRNGQCNFRTTTTGFPAIRLCSTWWDSEEILHETGVEELLMGMASQIAEREDNVLCSDVRNKLFGPMDFMRRDLGALNIMRGRDNGIPDYNTVRQSFQLPRLTKWEDINPGLANEKPDLFEQLKTLYEDINKIDLFVGGMLETELSGRPGILFRTIIKQQFERLRDADRFWFENPQSGVFTPEEVAEIRRITMYDVIINATSIRIGQIQRNVFSWHRGDPCPQPSQLSSSMMEPCAILDGYDYFHGNEVAYIYSCIALTFIPIICAGLGYGVIKLQNKRRRKIRLKQHIKMEKHFEKLGISDVKEWLHQNHKREVQVKIGPDESLSTINRKGEILRKVDFKSVNALVVEETQDVNKKPMVLIRSPRDHDLVLQFVNSQVRQKFISKLESFLLSKKKTLEIIKTYRDVMLTNAETKEKRQKRLEHFFREAYALTFGLKPGEKRKLEDVGNDVIMVMRTSLSKKEFAEALGMKADSLFVKQMFNCVDKDKDGRISFQEFLDTVVLFSRGKTEDKLRIVFDMCDDDGNGVIDKQELTKMLRSLVDIAKTNSLTENQVMELIQGMFAAAGLEDKEELNYDDFKVMMKEYKGDFIAIGLDCKGAKQNFLDTSTNVARMTSFQISQPAESQKGLIRKKWNYLSTFLEEYRQHIFYLFVFYVITLVLFLERFIFYSYFTEHMDLRHVMGLGIAFTRGSAASLSFCYSLLLLTMCRNLITKLRELPVHQYIPLDSHVQFHKIVALTALVFTLIHVIGHCINFYHVSTQPLDHLKCLTKEMQFESDFKPTITFWLFQTITGITGIILFAIVCIIFIFAHPRIRQKAYSYFWTTHSLYILLFILSLIHGLAKLTGSPRFWMFFIGPGVIFTLDKIISLQTKFVELDILDTELLPSDVTKVKFARPPNFKYLSGQWVRLSCTAFRPSEYHSLTLTSAPHENYLSVHVKAQGPWTWKLRNYFDPNNMNNAILPKIRLEGPYGGGNQDWYKFEIAVMVGGGIGVTPYASILNDLVFGTSTNRYSGVACKKVYFLWICPSHRHFEWFIDVLRDVERKDVTNVLEVHIFITQFFHKFDLRTTMLYICENHFQRISNRSMFTGLKAINHFGRPDMTSFLKFVQHQHSYVSKVGVFSCGPSALTKSISTSCETVNKTRKLPYFLHHFENF